MTVTIWRGGMGDVGVISHSRTTLPSALKLAYQLMRAYPQMQTCNIYGDRLVKWWVKDAAGFWQPQNPDFGWI